MNYTLNYYFHNTEMSLTFTEPFELSEKLCEILDVPGVLKNSIIIKTDIPPVSYTEPIRFGFLTSEELEKEYKAFKRRYGEVS